MRRSCQRHPSPIPPMKMKTTKSFGADDPSLEVASYLQALFMLIQYRSHPLRVMWNYVISCLLCNFVIPFTFNNHSLCSHMLDTFYSLHLILAMGGSSHSDMCSYG